MQVNNKYNCIIIEDELPAAELLELYISNVDFLQLMGKFSNATQALKIINTEKIDLLFLDINLPRISGIDFIKSLNPAPSAIFTTAYSEYAVESFNIEAIDYLLKPISFERFIKAVNRFLKLKNVQNNNMLDAPSSSVEKPFIFIKCDKKMVKLILDQILFFEAQKNYLLIHTESEVYRAHHSISEMEEKIPEDAFIRIHRSFIVAVKKISTFTHSNVEIGTTKIPIGRLFLQNTSNHLKSYFK
ncbi:MAG: response regulator transcription factor [Chitinophagaceae bacterium]|nr:response regulator transcription factor [Chitinophagaceae bacterium]